MTEIKKELKRLGHQEFEEDIKGFNSSSHRFFKEKVPEIKTMAKKMHEEHSLKQFYRVFNKLWNSGYEKERALAISALQLYGKDFDASTWKMLKPKIKEIKDDEQMKSVRDILERIIKNCPELKKEICRVC